MSTTVGHFVTGGGTRDVISTAATVNPPKPSRVLVKPPPSSQPLVSTSRVADRAGNGTLNESTGHFVFGPVPSKEEAEQAVSTLQRLFEVSYSQLSEDDSSPLKKDVYQPRGWNKVIDAFHLLRRNPSVQRMVLSLSSDRAVWSAAMKNMVAEELIDFFYPGRSHEPRSSEGDPGIASRILSWILENSKTKIMELITKITALVNELFLSREGSGNSDIFMDFLGSSFMLTVFVFIVVVVGRFQKAESSFPVKNTTL